LTDIHALHRAIAGRESLQRLWLGGALLGLGGLFYLLVRPAGLAVGLFGALPTLLHVVALSLFTAVVISPGRRGTLLVCSGWVAVNVAFEVGQMPINASAAAYWLDAHCSGIACRHSAQFFLQGTFDVLDVLAALLGGLIAWCCLRSRVPRVRT
jgi:hypothetical protein